MCFFAPGPDRRTTELLRRRRVKWDANQANYYSSAVGPETCRSGDKEPGRRLRAGGWVNNVKRVTGMRNGATRVDNNGREVRKISNRDGEMGRKRETKTQSERGP